MRTKTTALLLIIATIFSLIFFLFWDMDSDGITNVTELNLGTSINNADTDEDNITDGIEVNNLGTNPLNQDSDYDSLSDWLEVYTYGTNPLSQDTDGDTLTDSTELQTYFTNPLSTDTDNDTLSDSIEIDAYGSNPINSDSDNDNLDDPSEISLGTEIMDSDSDGDRLSDGTEIEWGSNPLVADSDSDGLTDWSERNVYLTNPNSTDSDGDGMSDRLEVLYSTDPADGSETGQIIPGAPDYPRLLLEIDYMTGYGPTPEAVGYIENYFEKDLGVDVEITQDEVTDSELTGIGVTPESLNRDEAILVESNFHDNPTTHLYVFYARDLENAEIGGLAGGNHGVILDGEYVLGTAARERTVLLHEIGHALSLNHTENPECAMQVRAISQNPRYCRATWRDRNLLDVWSVDEPW